MKLVVRFYTCTLMFLSTYVYGQMDEFAYKREITGVSDQWDEIILPDAIYGKVTQSLTDIRIYGILANKDTVEAPYLLRRSLGKVFKKEVAFQLFNSSYNDQGYYFTFEIPTSEPINQIKLNFRQKNFDWRVDLEGSNDHNEWFTVIDNYRILSIDNWETHFQYTTLNFARSRYRYIRLHIRSTEKPEGVTAGMALHQSTAGRLKRYPVRNFETKENERRQTVMSIELIRPVPISQLTLGISDTFDFYRPVTVEYLADSFKTELGWKQRYGRLASGTLNSLEENILKFKSTTVQKLRIIITNRDNQPLYIDSVQVQGYHHTLIARFTEPATYFLTYGNPDIRQPEYDINKFEDRIPETLTALQLGEEQTIQKPVESVSIPIFKNKVWLWTIMTAVILLLGLFTVKMIRNY